MNTFKAWPVVSSFLVATWLLVAGSLAQAPDTTAAPKTRVLVTDSQSWEQSGGFAATKDGAAGISRGGARPQTAEIIKTMGERCPEFTVTRNAAAADFILILDHEGGKGYALKDNKFALFNKDGDAIASGSTRSLGNSVKDACDALRKEQKTKTQPK